MIFLERVSSSVYHLTFLNTIAFIPQVMEPMFQLLIYVCSDYAFQNWRNDHKMDLGSHWVYYEMTWAKTPSVTWPS